MTCRECLARPAEDGKAICFACRVKSISIGVRGAAIKGSGGFHTSIRDFHQEHFGVESGKELAKTRPNVERYDD